jgi:hypothetical protein
MVYLHGAYEHALNGIGSLCLPIEDEASSADDFFRWFEFGVAMLPKIFAGANENFVSVALERVLDTVKEQRVLLTLTYYKRSLLLAGRRQLFRILPTI